MDPFFDNGSPSCSIFGGHSFIKESKVTGNDPEGSFRVNECAPGTRIIGGFAMPNM
jgi:hypothetical protein